MDIIWTVEGQRIIWMLTLIEGVLCLDNAIGLNGIVVKLEKSQQKRAFLFGWIGAVVLRGVCLYLAGFLVGLSWVKMLGGGYLLYLAAKHLARPKENDKSVKARESFWRAVGALMLMDLVFSLDNVIAAVSFTPNMWLIGVGVGMGMLVMLIFGGVVNTLVHRYPWAEKLGYLVILVVAIEMILGSFGVDVHIPGTGDYGKIIPTILTIVLGLVHEKSPRLKYAMKNQVKWARRGLRNYVTVVDWFWQPIGAFIDNLMIWVCVPEPVRIWLKRGRLHVYVSSIWLVTPAIVILSPIYALGRWIEKKVLKRNLGSPQ